MSRSYFAVSKVRENMQKESTGGNHGNASGGASAGKTWEVGNKAAGPAEAYSSKMMKSIWGQYNRYSVHNFKSSQGASSGAPCGQAATASGSAHVQRK